MPAFAIRNFNVCNETEAAIVVFYPRGGETRVISQAISGYKFADAVVSVADARRTWKESLAKGFVQIGVSEDMQAEPAEKTEEPAAPIRETVSTPETFADRVNRHPGGETQYRYSLFGRATKYLYTEGVKFVAEEARAYWLIDAIYSHQPKCRRDAMLRDFQIWFLKSNGKGGAVLTCWRDTGKGQRAAIRQEIEFTDFPVDQFGKEGLKLYVENNGDGMTIMLPSER